MKKAVVALCLTVGFAFSAWGHIPEGQVLLAYQFPPGGEPTMDGDLSDWAMIPEDYWIGPEVYASPSGELWTDLSSLNSKVIVGYSASTDRLYMHHELFDDFRRRDVSGYDFGAGNPPPLPESFEMNVDGDHGGEDTWVDGEDDRSRFAQNIHIRLPDIDPGPSGNNEATAWAWFWQTKATWTGEEPWAANGYSSDSAVLNASDVTGQAEWFLTLWNNLQWDDPDASEVHDMQEGQIIGLNWDITDYDNEVDNSRSQWVLNGEGTVWSTASVSTDFLLAPMEDNATAVEAESWGRIKAAFGE